MESLKLKKKILKTSMYEFNSRLDIAKHRISELQKIGSVRGKKKKKPTQIEAPHWRYEGGGEQKIQKRTKFIYETWRTKFNTHVIGMSEKEKQWDRAIFEAVLSQNSPKSDKSHQIAYF